MNAYKTKKQRVAKRLLEKEIARKGMTRSVENFYRHKNCLKTKKSLLTKTNEQLVSGLSRTIIPGSGIRNKLLKYIPPMYIHFGLNVENAIMSYCSKEISDLELLTSELREY